jgi:hypothetical protein
MFGRFRVIDSLKLNQAFPNWHQVNAVKYAADFCDRLREWSANWNLNEDWCRDHAIAALRNELCGEDLKWSFLGHRKAFAAIWAETVTAVSENDLEDVLPTFIGIACNLVRTRSNGALVKAWDWAASELMISALISRHSLSVEVHGGGGDPEPFEFKWPELEFVRPGFNVVRESKSRYKRRMGLEFRIYLKEQERSKLLSFLNDETRTFSEKDLAPNRGALQGFKRQLEQHVTETVEKTSTSQQYFVKTIKRPQLSKHLRWTVEYQIPPVSTLSEIAEAHEIDMSSVSRSVTPSLKLLGLRKRPDARGRIPGSKNTYQKVLKNLGR